MKKNYFLIFALFLSSFAIAQSGERYCDEIFSDVTVAADVVYGANISILPPAGLLELKMDVYTGTGDDATDRPVILVAHTGSFLPPFYNGQATGARGDSSVVEICNRLAKRGYVAIAYTYRQGWLPTAADADVRKSTLIQAAYRGIQDTRTAIRFLKMDADSLGNTYGVDPSKIGVWGIGTGGYLSTGAATVNDPEEMNLAKLINLTTAQPYVHPSVFGDIYGTSTGIHPVTMSPLCVPNHVGYSSDFALSISMGGALGAPEWLTGHESEPAMIGVHCPTDIFGPYELGDVIVPTTKQLVISDALGVKGSTALANSVGNNDAYSSIAAADDPMRAFNVQYEGKEFTTPAGNKVALTTDNFYPFFTGNPFEGAPWSWWNEAVVTQIVDVINTRDTSAHLSAVQIHQGGLATNPDMSSEKARRYIDSTMMLVLPRMSVTFGLGCAATDVVNIDASEVGLNVYPNPATAVVNFVSNDDAPIQNVFIYDMNGRLVKAVSGVNLNTYKMKRNALTSGIYFAKLTFEKGVTTQKIIFE